MSALNIKKGSTSHSAYDLRTSNSEVEESHTLAVIVENENADVADAMLLHANLLWLVHT